MHLEGWARTIMGLLALVSVAAALLALDATTLDTHDRSRGRVQTEVLGQVETRAATSPLPAAEVAQPVEVEPAPNATAVPSSTPSVVAPPPTTTVSAPSTAAAAPDVAASAESTGVQRAQQAISEIDYPWQTRFPAWRIEIAGPRSGLRALTHPADRRIELFVRADDSVAGLRRILAHELGHVADLELNDETDRQRWREARGVGAAVPWWPDGTSFDFDTLAGDFAEGFATWLEGSATQSRVGGPISADELALMTELVG